MFEFNKVCIKLCIYETLYKNKQILLLISYYYYSYLDFGEGPR